VKTYMSRDGVGKCPGDKKLKGKNTIWVLVTSKKALCQALVFKC